MMTAHCCWHDVFITRDLMGNEGTKKAAQFRLIAFHSLVNQDKKKKKQFRSGSFWKFFMSRYFFSVELCHDWFDGHYVLCIIFGMCVRYSSCHSSAFCMKCDFEWYKQVHLDFPHFPPQWYKKSPEFDWFYVMTIIKIAKTISNRIMTWWNPKWLWKSHKNFVEWSSCIQTSNFHFHFTRFKTIRNNIHQLCK